MKIKTNIRAGAKSGTVASGNGGSSVVGSTSTDSTSTEVQTVDPVVVYYPPVSRCTGI